MSKFKKTIENINKEEYKLDMSTLTLKILSETVDAIDPEYSVDFITYMYLSLRTIAEKLGMDLELLDKFKMEERTDEDLN